jgi:pimeloyl-ACP methyl ester carboxylesterase
MIKRIVRLLVFAVLSLSVALSATFGWLCYQQARLLVLSPRSVATRTPADYGIRNFQDVSITTVDGVRLGAWYAPPTRTDGASIIFIHGHVSNRSHFLARAALFVEQGYGMLFLDLRHHGTSDGDISTMGLLEVQDVEAAFDFLTQQPELNPDRIAIYGHSMGGATAIMAFRRIPQARVLIAESAYSSVEDNLRLRIVQDLPIPAFILPQVIILFCNVLTGENLFDVRPIDDIQHLDGRPVLLVHGRLDNIVPLENSERLFAAAHEPKAFWQIEGAGHMGSFEVSAQVYATSIIPFLEQYLVNE